MSTSNTRSTPALSPRDKLSDRHAVNALTAPLEEARRDSKTRFNKNIILQEPSTHSETCTCCLCSITDVSTPVEDTVHYLSPASMSPLSARTVDEGDLYAYVYKTPSFMHFLEEYKGLPEATVSSSISCVEPELQRTLAVVKPEAMEYEDVIVRAIVDSGFQILHKRYIHLTPEQVSEIYAQHYGTPTFPHMVVSMSIGPVLSLCIGAINAVTKWRDMVGPDRILRAEWFFPMSMRVRFGLHDDVPGAVHASENFPEANKENRYVNPESILDPITSEDEKVKDYLNMYVNPTLLNGLADVVRVKPIDPILHIAEWLLQNNPFQPRFPQTISVLPT